MKKVLLSLCVFLTACSQHFRTPQPDDPQYAPVPPARIQPPPNYSGSIYQAGFEKRLFEDRRAFRVGDMLTVQLIENTSASKSAETKVSKDTSATLNNPTLLGSTPQFNTPKLLPLASNLNNNLSIGIDNSSSFNGKGEADQSNNLSGTITVTVADVLPNGYLLIRGEKWLTLNRGDEFIRFSGTVNPDDITSNNTVNSTRIANARITYSGRGAVAHSNAMGFLSKFFNGPLWPF